MIQDIKIITQVELSKKPYRGYNSETIHYVYDRFTELKKYRGSVTNLRKVKQLVKEQYGEYTYSHVGTIRVDK